MKKDELKKQLDELNELLKKAVDDGMLKGHGDLLWWFCATEGDRQRIMEAYANEDWVGVKMRLDTHLLFTVETLLMVNNKIEEIKKGS